MQGAQPLYKRSVALRKVGARMGRGASRYQQVDPRPDMVNIPIDCKGAGGSPISYCRSIGRVRKKPSINGSASLPSATASRGSVTPLTVVLACCVDGLRSASLAARSIIKPTAASGSKSKCRMPSP